MMEVEQIPADLSAEDKRKYLFLKQINTLNAFRKRNAISKGHYDISYKGLISKMGITEDNCKDGFKPKRRS